MTRYIAFLRGINLGKRRLKMDRLAELFEEIGYENVATFIASGNVIFDSDADEQVVARTIEAHLRERLGYEVDTFIRSMDVLRDIARRDVFSDLDGAGWGLYVIFLSEAPGAPAADAVSGLQTPDDRFEIREREIYWLRNGRLSDSTLSTAGFTRCLGGASSTMRNMNTVRRIIDKYGADDGATASRSGA